MSRVGKNPVPIPAGVKVSIDGERVAVQGPLGSLEQHVRPIVRVALDGDQVVLEPTDESVGAHVLSGTYRSLIANMVHGVSKGFEKRLLLVGTGFRAQVQGNALNLSLGFSHPVVHALPDGVKAKTPVPTEIVLEGADKQVVGQVAAEIRRYRKPEPYKGKGVRYADERVVLKEVKKK